MHYLFKITIRNLSPSQYKPICATTMVCLTCRWTSTPQRLNTHSAEWPYAPRLTSAELNLFARSCMTNRSAAYLPRGNPYLTCRPLQVLPLRGELHTLVVYQTAPRLNNASCKSKHQWILTHLSTLAVTGRCQLSPYQAKVNHLSIAVQPNQINKS